MALKHLLFHNVFIIILYYLNHQHGKPGVWRGEREEGKVERQGERMEMSNSQPLSTELWLELEMLLLIQCLFISSHKTLEVRSE